MHNVIVTHQEKKKGCSLKKKVRYSMLNAVILILTKEPYGMNILKFVEKVSNNFYWLLHWKGIFYLGNFT